MHIKLILAYEFFMRGRFDHLPQSQRAFPYLFNAFNAFNAFWKSCSLDIEGYSMLGREEVSLILATLCYTKRSNSTR